MVDAKACSGDNYFVHASLWELKARLVVDMNGRISLANSD
jgi:hypothetical protein